MEMGVVLLEGEDAAEDRAGPDVVFGFAPSCWMLESAVQGGRYAYLNDWPHRRVVSRQSSVRPMGNFCHGMERKLVDIVAIEDDSVQIKFKCFSDRLENRETRRDSTWRMDKLNSMLLAY